MDRHTAAVALVTAVMAGLVLSAQAGDAKKILADARAALGGDARLDAVKTLTMSGQALRTSPTGNTTGSDVEMAFELPDKFVRREAAISLGNMSVYRTSGFNGDGVISEMDMPPQLSGGGANVVMFRAGPGGAVMGPGAPPLTPEQQQAARQAALTSAKRDFARLMLGLFAASSPAFPLTMTYAGEAESPDGRADVIDVKGEGDFAARLFVDSKTHLPLMLSWMAKEPLQIIRQVGGPAGSGGAAPITKPPGKLTPEDREALARQMEAQRKDAEAKARIVEYRLFYADYKEVDGITLPFRLERSIDGKPTEEITFEKIKVNPKIDAKKFAVSK